MAEILDNVSLVVVKCLKMYEEFWRRNYREHRETCSRIASAQVLLLSFLAFIESNLPWLTDAAFVG